MKKLDNILAGNTGRHILPFLWIHGEDAESMCREIQHIYDSGIRALCAEARPHQDFNGETWFRDLEVILAQCKKLDMEMWLLDDSHFPTGYANGEIRENHPELRKKFLRLKSYDFSGPLADSGACLKYALLSPEDEILGIYLQKRLDFETIELSNTIDVTPTLHYVEDYYTGRPNQDWSGKILPGKQGRVPFVNFSLPEGNWYLNVVSVSYLGGEKQTEDYLNPIVPEATAVLLDTVYQPVYDHFKEEFGKAFQGFFSDEPRFGNIHGAEGASIGRNSEMVLPWRDDLAALLASHCRKLGGNLADMTEEKLFPLLPLLFINSPDMEMAHALRYAYMDLVSRLYSEHFDGRIAQWCHAHHCRHIGHAIEDNDAASRLGYGAGHIFRAMAHADMAGIDVVFQQLLPGFHQGLFKGMHRPGWDSEFFTYLLGKLGGSLAHLDPKKDGNCMCELFGAYGWAEGNRLGKWLADYMLVRGVNKLVPHAFNCAPFPDPDCPPHFCSEGKNPQYPEFRLLIQYCTRLCELLSGGKACPDVALFFNAEGEWSGDYQSTQKPAMVLAENCVDYDLISGDYLAQAQAIDGKLCINGMSMNGLVMPWAEALPASILADVLRLAQGGVPVWFVNGIPGRVTEGRNELLAALSENGNVHMAALENLASALLSANMASLTLSDAQPDLRAYHYRQDDGDVYFFVNESVVKPVNTIVSGKKAGIAYCYDPFTNTLAHDEEAFSLHLPPYGSKTVIVPDMPMAEALPAQAKFIPSETLMMQRCTLRLAPMEELKDGNALSFSTGLKLEKPVYLSSIPGYETFAGRMQYIFHPVLTKQQAGKKAQVVLHGVREGASVWVNGSFCGTKICPDYQFPTENLAAGENTVTVELNTTLGRRMNEYLSSFLPMEPMGLQSASLELG